MNEDWFYFRKNNSRMENENLYTSLAYLQFALSDIKERAKQPFEYYKVAERINFRIKSKTEITKILEDSNYKNSFLTACNSLENEFIPKVKDIVANSPNDTIDIFNKNLESIFNVSSIGRRTQQSFYALWHFLSKIPNSSITSNKQAIRIDLRDLFQSMNNIDSKEEFEKNIAQFWNKYR